MRIEEGVRKRIQKMNNEEVTGLDLTVATALNDINKDADSKKNKKLFCVRDTIFCSTEELIVDSNKILLIHVPKDNIDKWRMEDLSIVAELEKKFPGRTIFVVKYKKITRKENLLNIKNSQYNSLIEDIVYPSEITGRRMKFDASGQKTSLFFIDRNTEKLTCAFLDEVIKKLTGTHSRFMVYRSSDLY